ncbi:MAG: hypothetical protein KDK12_18015 [Rhodobacteraceae bacterium]|nr:hypothetical protein [Paracoccaceae bacterium]
MSDLCQGGWDGQPVQKHVRAAEAEAARAHERLDEHLEALQEQAGAIERLQRWLSEKGFADAPRVALAVPDE